MTHQTTLLSEADRGIDERLRQAENLVADLSGRLPALGRELAAIREDLASRAATEGGGANGAANR
jgi:hypothetical protein